MSSQLILNLIIVAALTTGFAGLWRRKLCDWEAASFLFGLGLAMLAITVLLAWAFGQLERVHRWLILDASIGGAGDQIFGPVPFAYSLIATSWCAVLCRLVQNLRPRNTDPPLMNR
jgi:hypothetical protein